MPAPDTADDASWRDAREQQARAHGFTELRLYTNERMTENLAYYPRRGHVETGRHVQDGYARVFFSKQLPRLD